MRYDEISALVSDESTDIVYISDLETYELYYLNKTGIDMIGSTDESQWKNKKCYKVLQGKDAPCEFCTNHKLTLDKYYEWEYYNPILNSHYALKDKLIELNGKNVRLEVASNITKRVSAENKVKLQLEDETTLNRCVEMLHTSLKPADAVQNLLQILAEYHNAERAYIFSILEEEIDGEKFADNTFEWCAKGIVPQIDNLKHISMEPIKYWFDKFDEVGEFSIDSLSEEIKEESFEYDILDAQGIKALITAPMRDVNGNYSGFIGIDNPICNTKRTAVIRSVAKFISDFLDKNEILDELHKLSYFDRLTGLKNRQSYRIALENFEKNPAETLGVVYADINGLKGINDTQGHEAGDMLIIKLSKIIKEVFGEKGIFRLGGDEFVVLNENVGEKEFEDELSTLKILIAKEKDLKVSIGYSWNKNTKNITDEIGKADTLMYMEKQSLYSNEYINSNYSVMLSQNLAREIEDNRFVVFLQPQVNIKDKKVSGAEALVRKVDINGKIQAPISFLPFYEKEGIIPLVDFFVFETVCKTLEKWKNIREDLDLKIAVNLSRVTVFEEKIVEKLQNICKKYNIKTDEIMIEITETIRSINDDIFSKILIEFSEAGFYVSLDDFGSGHSNLSIIVNSDFDEIKIDRSLIMNLATCEKSKLLTLLSINLCNSLRNVISLAEGIEEEEQYELLKELGCTKGQGYYFDKPLPLDTFESKYINL